MTQAYDEMEGNNLFTQLFNVLSSLMDEHLPGWSVKNFRYWETDEGNNYCEMEIHVFEEILSIRLREHEGSLRVVNATLRNKVQRTRKIKPHEQEASRDQP